MLRPVARHRSNIYSRHNHHYHYHHFRLITITSKRHANTAIRSICSHSQNQDQIKNAKETELSLLPFPHLLRNIAISWTYSSPTFSNLSYKILKWMLDCPTNSHPRQGSERLSPLLKWILKKSLYAHFCAGENRAEIKETLKELKISRYDGVILEYALEVLDTGKRGGNEGRKEISTGDNNEEAIDTWRKGMLETVNMVEPGHFVGLKSVFLRIFKREKKANANMTMTSQMVRPRTSSHRTTQRSKATNTGNGNSHA